MTGSRFEPKGAAMPEIGIKASKRKRCAFRVPAGKTAGRQAKRAVVAVCMQDDRPLTPLIYIKPPQRDRSRLPKVLFC